LSKDETKDLLNKNGIGLWKVGLMSFWVYMLCCADESYYVGHTDNLEVRLAKHQNGEYPGYTVRRRPVKLVFTEEFASRDDAFERERQLKGWSRKKKEALIRGDWAEISRLAHPSTSSG
jgi:predicted GIY-YIG superfamily endonuclease